MVGSIPQHTFLCLYLEPQMEQRVLARSLSCCDQRLVFPFCAHSVSSIDLGDNMNTSFNVAQSFAPHFKSHCGHMQCGCTRLIIDTTTMPLWFVVFSFQKWRAHYAGAKMVTRQLPVSGAFLSLEKPHLLSESRKRIIV